MIFKVSLTWLAIVTVFAVTELKAQIITAVGVKAGLTESNQRWSSPNFQPKWHDRPGGRVGLFAEFLKNRVFRIITEVNFSEKGMQDKQPVTFNNSEPADAFIIKDNRLDYLSFNLLYKFQYSGRSVVPYMVFGPRFDVLLDERVSQFFALSYDGLESTVFGLSAGGGVELELRPTVHLLAEVRYDHDFTSSVKFETLTIKNKSLDFQVGLKLGFGHQQRLGR